MHAPLNPFIQVGKLPYIARIYRYEVSNLFLFKFSLSLILPKKGVVMENLQVLNMHNNSSYSTCRYTPHTKYYMPSCSDSIIFSIKLDVKYRFYAIVMLFFIRKGNELL
jgi:hypothetical protein